MVFAVMQPYLFPYLGYYQLVHSVDTFVFYDDVTFIKGGYINRNRILSNGQAQLFTLPVPGKSSNVLINKLAFDKNTRKQLKLIEQSYSKAPFFGEIFPIVKSVINAGKRNVEHICRLSITQVMDYLGIKRRYHYSSDMAYDRDVSSAHKLINISAHLNSNEYINSPGGKSLYSKEMFNNNGVSLKFIKTKRHRYRQKSDLFIPNLSMIDVLMWNSKAEAIRLLGQYELT